MLKCLAVNALFVYLYNKTMATPIKITPPLSGRQSRNFNTKLSETSKKRVSADDKSRIFTLVEKILSDKKSK